MADNFKPMLAATLDQLEDAELPALVSPKLDGVRALVRDGTVVSRNLKPLRNKHVQKLFGHKAFEGLDGELIVGSPVELGDGTTVLGRTQSGVMSTEGTPDVRFYVFDLHNRPGVSYEERYQELCQRAVQCVLTAPIVTVRHHGVKSVKGLLQFEAKCIADGYEGIMLRSFEGLYKHGRSTPTEGWLWKFKRFTDGEGVILRFEEGARNLNEVKRDLLGRAERSSAKSGKVASGLVGTIVVRDVATGQELRLAPGTMTAVERAEFWVARDMFVGHLCHWRAFGYGNKDSPRFPRWCGLRSDI